VDNFLAFALIIALLLRGIPFVMTYASPSFRRQMEGRLARFFALLDVAVGTLMLIFFGVLVWQRAWLAAVLLGLISLSSWRALWSGLVLLARTPPR
jgi:hypothetical protein